VLAGTGTQIHRQSGTAPMFAQPMAAETMGTKPEKLLMERRATAGASGMTRLVGLGRR